MSGGTSIVNLLRTIAWAGDHLVILDQTLLPVEHRELRLDTMEAVFEAIRHLRVRGAPLIGVTAAFGLYLGMRDSLGGAQEEPRQALTRCVEYLSSARPTAVNLTWALQRAASDVAPFLDAPGSAVQKLLASAQECLARDVAANRAIGVNGLPLLRGLRSILTHCNAGWLATAGYGTALAPLYIMLERGEETPHVFVDETRPVLQGARLTAWELTQVGIAATLICDNMAATVMAQGRVQAVIVGCDRMAANGDFANKVGTLGVAILAREFGIPFYVALPTSSIDPDLPTGAGIPIEERAAAEILQVGCQPVAPQIAVFNPAFDVTPSRYVTAIVTERRVLTPPFETSLRGLLAELRQVPC